MELTRFNLVAVDVAATFISSETVLRAAARQCPHAGRLLVYDGGTGRPLPPASPWLYHDTLDKRDDPTLVRRRLDAMSAESENLRNLEDRG